MRDYRDEEITRNLSAEDRKTHLYITRWGLICGLNDGVDILMKIEITGFLREYYSHMDLDELTTAMRLYAAQKLDFKDSIYNNMNPTFIGKVLVSYSEHKRKGNLLSLPKPEQKALPEAEIPIEKQRENSYKFIETIYTKEGKFPIIANWVDAYFHLHKTGLINTTKQEFEEEKLRISTSLKNEVIRKKSMGIKECFEKMELENEISIKKEAAKNIVQKYVIAL